MASGVPQNQTGVTTPDPGVTAQTQYMPSWYFGAQPPPTQTAGQQQKSQYEQGLQQQSQQQQQDSSLQKQYNPQQQQTSTRPAPVNGVMYAQGAEDPAAKAAREAQRSAVWQRNQPQAIYGVRSGYTIAPGEGGPGASLTTAGGREQSGWWDPRTGRYTEMSRKAAQDAQPSMFNTQNSAGGDFMARSQTEPPPAAGPVPPTPGAASGPTPPPPSGWNAQSRPFGELQQPGTPQGAPGSPMEGQAGNMFGDMTKDPGQYRARRRGNPAGMLGGGTSRNMPGGWQEPIIGAFMGG